MRSDQIPQNFIQLGPESLQIWRLHDFSVCFSPVFSIPHGEEKINQFVFRKPNSLFSHYYYPCVFFKDSAEANSKAV